MLYNKKNIVDFFEEKNKPKQNNKRINKKSSIVYSKNNREGLVVAFNKISKGNLKKVPMDLEMQLEKV